MRHEGPGFLSVPDFPKIYGEWLPAFWDAKVLAQINQLRATQWQWPETSSVLIFWQVTHRTLGVLTGLGVLGGAFWSTRSASTPRWWRQGIRGWVSLAILQVALGVSVIWTGRIPELATIHVLMGAALILTGFLLGLASWRSTNPSATPRDKMTMPTEKLVEVAL